MDNSKVIDTIGDHVGGKSRTAQTRPTLLAFSSSRRQHLPTPPRQKMRGSNGVVLFWLREKRTSHDRPVAADDAVVAIQTKRLSQSRCGPVGTSWTRVKSIPFSCKGATTA